MITVLRWVRQHFGLAVELAGYAFWLFLDLVLSVSDGHGAWIAIAAGVSVPLIVLSRRLPGVQLERVAAGAIGLSIAFTLLSAALHVLGLGAHPWIDLSFAEMLSLAVLVVNVLWKLPLRPGLTLSVIAAVAIMSAGLARNEHTIVAAYGFLCALGWGSSVGIGLVLREVALRRAAALDDVRNSERMELARDLHDVVAHQVTGIIVAAQAASVVARRSPEEVDKALAAIEAAGAEALTAMRRMVGVLRGQDSDGARTPGAELGDLRTLVDRFDPEEQLVTLRTDPGLEHAVLPPGVAVTGYRVVQEALTNVRRHAVDAGTVEVDVRIREEALRVSVRNDGVTGEGRPRGGTGGFGLAGMAERVTALDGELTAGPSGPGVWLVDARIPLRGAQR